LNESNSNLLDVLTREGVLINVSVRFWRGCKKLKPEDLGLDARDVSDRLISLGHKRLLPKEATSNLSLIEGRAHALIEANTFPFLNGLSHFLPNTRLEEVTAKLKALETEFWEGKAEFVRHYSRHRANAMDEWRTAAARLVADPERTVAAIGAAFPTTLDKHFGFDVTLFQLALPERLQVDLVTLSNSTLFSDRRVSTRTRGGTSWRSEIPPPSASRNHSRIASTVTGVGSFSGFW